MIWDDDDGWIAWDPTDPAMAAYDPSEGWIEVENDAPLSE